MHPILESKSTFDFSDVACSLEVQINSSSYRFSHHDAISLDKFSLAMPEEWKCDDEEDIDSKSQCSSDSEPGYGEGEEGVSESSSGSLMDILFSIEDMSEDILFTKNGYKKVGVISDTIQGKSFKAQIMKDKEETDHFVAIKECDKKIFKKKIAIEDGMSFFVSKDIKKEGKILKYLTVDNCPLGNYIIKYIDFFESNDAYYLVMEYCESELNLKEFIDLSWYYIKADKLKMNNYKKFIKCVYWQLAVTMRWLHHDMKCCHLDLCLENIMLTNCNFINNNDGSLTINPDISIRLADFGTAEVFKKNDFECHKTRLSIDNHALLAPEVLRGGSYNAQKADIWSLGMILFECITGQQLHTAGDMFANGVNIDEDHFLNGYWSVTNGKLIEYLVEKDLLKYFKADCVSLLCHLLDTDPSTRYDTNDIIQDKWFNLYHKTYNQRIMKKSRFQRQALLKQSNKMAAFPYYDHKRLKHDHEINCL